MRSHPIKFASSRFCSIRHFRGRSSGVAATFTALIFFAAAAGNSFGQSEFEGRRLEAIEVLVDGTPITAGDFGAAYLRTIREAAGDHYSTVRIRDSIERLFLEKDIAAVEVEAARSGPDNAILNYRIRRKKIAKRVTLEIKPVSEGKVTEQELLFKLDLLDPGTIVSDESLQMNANTILEYLRERGFLRARVDSEQQQLAVSNEVAVVFRIDPGEPAKVSNVTVDVSGFDAEAVVRSFKLKVGQTYTRDLMNADADRIRAALIAKGFLAPTLERPRAIYDGENNTMAVVFAGEAGPQVEVTVETEDGKLGSRTKERLLPVAREGTLDFAAIIEGGRRLENYYQEKGYFFAAVTPICAIAMIDPVADQPVIIEESETLCSSLSSFDFTDKKAIVKYKVDLDRRLKLNDIRLSGTSLFTIEEILSVLESQRANILGIIPLFGYGRGFTSNRILEQDAATIRSLLRELGYRDATVRTNLGVSPDGENLIITFVVDEGLPTTVSDVSITGNSSISTTELLSILPNLRGENFSRARVRAGKRKLEEYYSNAGYYDAAIDFSVDQAATVDGSAPRTVKLVFNVRNEGRPVYVKRILITGNIRTREESIRRAIVVQEGVLLKAADVYLSEQNLYSSDVFSQIEITPQPAGDRPDGGRDVDLIVSVTEQPARIITYGGGFSTDVGWSGFADFRHFNLFGRLMQGGARISWSQRQQLVQVDFVDPRFIREKANRFAPLTLSLQYRRDSTVTRFFRSAFDKGTFGIVQRVDKNGVPIDVFGAAAGDPTINRLTFTAETNRTLSLKARSVVFIRYKFEDVRLLNIQSLLIKDLLEPDSRIRTSGFGATFVRDTRENCSSRYTILDIIAKGETQEPCRYNASDPTKGYYFTAEFNVSLPALGANVGFNKFQASYNFFRTFPRLRNTTFAGRAIIGAAKVFREEPRFGPPEYSGLEKILPISERFFAGGSNTLRGFAFEEAGPRVVVSPEGEFRDSDGDIVTLDPFTIPFGGNALAVVNLEARIPVSKSVRLVPFFDSGNVFLRAKDIFRKPEVPPNDPFRHNLVANWTHTIGLGFRLKTPVGGEFAVDYGYLLNPPSFIVPQKMGPPTILQLTPSKFHFRFSQAF